MWLQIKTTPPKNQFADLQPVDYITVPEDEDARKGEVAKTTKTVPFLGKYVKGIVFMDHAGVFPFKGRGPGQEGISAHDTLTSIGIGFRVTLPKDFTARLYWGYPLIHNINEPYYKSPRFHFELSLAPDFDAFLKTRKRRTDEKAVKESL